MPAFVNLPKGCRRHRHGFNRGGNKCHYCWNRTLIVSKVIKPEEALLNAIFGEGRHIALRKRKKHS